MLPVVIPQATRNALLDNRSVLEHDGHIRDFVLLLLAVLASDLAQRRQGIVPVSGAQVAVLALKLM